MTLAAQIPPEPPEKSVVLSDSGMAYQRHGDLWFCTIASLRSGGRRWPRLLVDVGAVTVLGPVEPEATAAELRDLADTIDKFADPRISGSVTVIEQVASDRISYHLRRRAHQLDGRMPVERSRTAEEIAALDRAMEAAAVFKGETVRYSAIRHRRPVDSVAEFLRAFADLGYDGLTAAEMRDVAAQLSGTAE